MRRSFIFGDLIARLFGFSILLIAFWVLLKVWLLRVVVGSIDPISYYSHVFEYCLFFSSTSIYLKLNNNQVDD
jgi:hypothetical protein